MPNAQDDQWIEALFDQLDDTEAGLSDGCFNDERKAAIREFQKILKDIDNREESEFKRIAGLCPQDVLSFGDGIKVAEHRINLKEEVKLITGIIYGDSVI